MGTVAIIGSALLMVFLLFVPVREGAAPTGGFISWVLR